MPEADDRIRFEKKRIREKTGSDEKQAADTEYEGGVAAQTTKIVDFDTKLITRSYFQKIDAGGRRQDTIREETNSRENGFGRKASRGYGIRWRRGRTHADTKINHFIL